jgi:hypothetical protein
MFRTQQPAINTENRETLQNPMISNAAIIFAMIRIVQSDDPSVFMPKL